MHLAMPQTSTDSSRAGGGRGKQLHSMCGLWYDG